MGRDYREGLCLGNTKAIPPAAEAVHRSVKMPQGETIIALIGYSILLLNVIIHLRREETEPSCRQFRGNPECYYEEIELCPATCRQNPEQSQCRRYQVRTF